MLGFTNSRTMRTSRLNFVTWRLISFNQSMENSNDLINLNDNGTCKKI